MIKNNLNQLINKSIFFAIMLFFVVPQVSGAESLGSAIDCSAVDINYTDNPEWSREERIKAMDKAFFESVHRFELCNISNQSNALSTTADGETVSNPDSVNGTEASSTESSAMKGTETGSEKGVDTEPTAKDSAQPKKTNSQSTEKLGSGSRANNGSSPKDIPSANNDDVIAAQIRVAAEIEPNPVKKKKLWNEYRKYKGLPTQ